MDDDSPVIIGLECESHTSPSRFASGAFLSLAALASQIGSLGMGQLASNRFVNQGGPLRVVGQSRQFAGSKGSGLNGINLSITCCGLGAKQRCRVNAFNVQSRLAFRVFRQNSRFAVLAFNR